MKTNIKLNEKQLQRLIGECFYIGDKRKVKFIELYIDADKLTLAWLQKNVSFDEYAKKHNYNFNTFTGMIFIGAITGNPSIDQLKKFIYHQIFKMKIRNEEHFYGAREICELDYHKYDHNLFRVLLPENY